MIKSQNPNDCYTCALATLLNIKYEDSFYIEEFARNDNRSQKDNDSYFNLRDKWLIENNLVSVSFPYSIDKPFPIFSGDKILFIADLQAETDTHAVVCEAEKDGDQIKVTITYDNHAEESYLGVEDIIYLEFVYKIL